jgi:hypothetical protein
MPAGAVGDPCQRTAVRRARGLQVADERGHARAAGGRRPACPVVTNSGVTPAATAAPTSVGWLPTRNEAGQVQVEALGRRLQHPRPGLRQRQARA